MVVRHSTRRRGCLIPRHILALNEIAKASGFTVSVRHGRAPGWQGLEEKDWFGENTIFATWTGAEENLHSTGLMRKFYRPPSTIGWICERHTEPWFVVRRMRPYFCGYVEQNNGLLTLELSFGPAPKSVSLERGIEVCKFEVETSYHGTLDHLIGNGILDSSKIPSAKRTLKHRNYNMSWREIPDAPYWFTKRQPDGTYVHYLETAAAFAQRREELLKEDREYQERREKEYIAKQSAGKKSTLDTEAKYRNALQQLLCDLPSHLLREMTSIATSENNFTLSPDSLETIESLFIELRDEIAAADIRRIKRDRRTPDEIEAARNLVAKAEADGSFQKFLQQLRP